MTLRELIKALQDVAEQDPTYLDRPVAFERTSSDLIMVVNHVSTRVKGERRYWITDNGGWTEVDDPYTCLSFK